MRCMPNLQEKQQSENIREVPREPQAQATPEVLYPQQANGGYDGVVQCPHARLPISEALMIIPGYTHQSVGGVEKNPL